MTTPTDYRVFSSDCVRWAQAAKDASQRQTFLHHARLWENAAKRLERHVVMRTGNLALFKELRSKLD